MPSGNNCLNVSGAPSTDSDCVVPINLYNFNVLETATPGTQIGHVYAYDRDLGDNGRVQYFKQNDTISLSAPFDVNPLNGSIFVLPQFTRLARKQSSYTMFVKAIDSAQIHFERRHSVAVIQINVTDINNSVPEFIGTAPFEAYVGESLPEGAFVTQIYAKDDDSITEQLEYSIVAGNDEKLFFIDSKSGKIYTSAVLDYEKKQSYDLLVQVSDGVNTAVAPLIINIIDINDQQPVFAHQFYNFTILEESSANQTVGQMTAIDRDSGKNALLTYSLVGEQANSAFILDPATGVMRTRRPIDCELEPVIDFLVVARDGGIPQLSGTANVRVKVDDINDWAPRFEQARYEVQVQEELEAPVDVYQIKAQDKDRDENGIIKYLIIGGNEQNLFNINADTGLISTAARLNYEAKREHRLQVAARNVKPFQGPQARAIVNPAVEITIRVADINDELVVFEKSSYHYKLSELTAKNTIIGRVNASNTHRSPVEQEIVYWLGPVHVMQAGAGGKRRTGNESAPSSTPTTTTEASAAAKSSQQQMQLSNKLFIDEKSGELVLLDQLDRDPPASEQLFRFSIFARDKRSINKLNVSVPVVIDVVDVNDNAPTFDELSYNLEMPENLPSGTTIPTFFKVHDVDSGINGRIAGYYINGSREEMDIFHINNVTGTITLKSSLDYERQSVHKFEILAVDGGQPQALIGSAQVIVQVANINEFSPKFINLPYEYQLQENAVPGTQVGQVKAIDQDGNKIVYSMSDGDTDFFSIESQSGKIYVSRQLRPQTQYSFIVRATDDGQPQNYSLGVQIVIRVRDTNDFAPVFTSNSYSGTVVEKQTRSGASNNANGVILRVEAIDKDLQNNTITYAIISGNEDQIFTIDKRKGEIKVQPQQAHKLDYDKRKQYTLLVQAQDSHESPLFGLTMVQIDVLDVNDHAPVFSKAAYVASLAENAPAGTCFFRVEADSRDSVDQITYSLSSNSPQSGNKLPSGSSSQTPKDSSQQQQSKSADSIGNLFEIHATKGLVCTKTPLDRELRGQYELTVTANDGKFESHAPISVEILDENDNRPIFDTDHYQVSIPYDSQPGRPVISVHAQDPDSGANGNVQYWIKNTHGLFQIDAKTGQVRVVTRLPSSPTNTNAANANATTTFELRVFAQDQGTSPQIGEATMHIRLTNSENHPPKFDKFAYQTSVDENISGMPLIQVQAQDPDPGKAGKIAYRLVRVQSASLISSKMASATSGGSSNALLANSKKSLSEQSASEQQVQLNHLRSAFKIDKSSGKVMLMEPLDYEETHNVELIIEAKDEALNDAQSTTAFVQVQVNDINDNRPEFLAMPKLLRISSSTQPNSEIIYTIQALDADSSQNGNNQIEYRLETPSKYFNVHPQTGALFAISSLPSTLAEGGQAPPEMEMDKLPGGATIYSETLTIIASDKSPSFPLMERTTLDIEVYRDQADDAHPIFNSNQYFVQSENSIEAGTVILIPKATIPNGDSILYNITAIDTGKQTSSATGSGRNGGGGGNSQSITATGANLAQATRSLVKRFAIDQETGKISTTSKLEPNVLAAKNIFHFIVKAINRNQPTLTSEAGVIVRLWDSESRCPRFPFTEYYASVAENARIDSIAVANLVIDDVERFAGQKLSYQITEDNSNDNFFIDVSSGGGKKINVSLRVKKALDREAMPKFLGGVYTLTISASNSRCATQAKVKIMIEDQNDNSPIFEKQDYFVDLKENSPIGQVISQLQATDADELDAQKLRYFIADGQPERDVFEMEQKSGTISVKAEIDREKSSSYLLRIMAVDQANNTGWTNLHLNILDENDWAPTFLNETFFMDATEGPTSIGTRIRLPVFDYDDGLNRQMEVFIVEGNSGNEFRLDVDEAGPLLTIVQELDWEKYSSATGGSELGAQLSPSMAKSLVAAGLQLPAPATAVHSIQIAAKDKGSPARVGKTTVVILIHDINDNAPKFTHESYYEFIDESAPIGTVVTTIKATDMDSPTNTNLTYSFVRKASSLAPSNLMQQQPQPQQQSTTPMMTQQSQPQPAVMMSATTGGSGAVPNSRQSAQQVRPATSGQLRPMQPVGLIARPRNMRPSAQTSGMLDSEQLASAALLETMMSGTGGGNDAGGPIAGPQATSMAMTSSTSLRKRIRRQAAPPSQNQNPFPFVLDPTTGVVSVSRQLDISEQQQYFLTVEAFDGLWRTETQMRIFVNEVEDPRDVSARSSEATNHYRFQVNENLPEALVGSVDLKPRKLRVNSQMKYSIVNSEMRSLFRITQNGEIFTLRGLDREQRAQYTFTVMLEEKRASSKLTVAEVIVDVVDENDEIPTFTHVYHGTIKENSPPGTPVFLLPSSTIRAVDNDTKNNSRITYTLSGMGSDRFAIMPSGSVQFQPQDESLILDRELKSEYKLDVHAADNGNLSSKTTLNIKIEDENDNAPIFETGPLFVLIPETAKAGSRIVQVKARDRDEQGPNSDIHYKISASTSSGHIAQSINTGNHNQFNNHQQQQQQQVVQAPALSEVIRIDQTSGELFVVGQLQPSTTYNISVTATDSGGLSAQTQVNVTVIDVNDHKPQFERSAYNFVVFEGNYSKGALKLGTLRATDDDLSRNSQIEYLLITDPQYEASLPITNPAAQLASLLQSPKSNSQANNQQDSTIQQPAAFPISIDVHTGELFARGLIDREQRDAFIFKVMAIDMGEPPMNSTCEVVVKVKDINDEPPRFYTDPYLALVPENLEPGHKVTQIAAFDPDSGENGQVFYKLGEGHEGKFYIDGKDGTVWTLASLDYEQRNFYNITIIAYDRGSPSLHSTAKLWITVADMNDAVPNFAKAVYTLEVAENAKLGDTIFALNAGKGNFKYSWLTQAQAIALANSASGSNRGQGGLDSQYGLSGLNDHQLGRQHSNHPLMMDMDQDEGTETFTIEPTSGHIKLAKPLDSVQRNHYRLMVKAQDESEPPKYDTAEINILVGTGQGVRLFAQRLYEVSVLENQLAPLVLIDLNCTDEMIHQPVQYSIVGTDHRGLFRIEPETGRISVTSSLDRERRDSYTIKIKAETGNLNVRQKRQVGSPHSRWSASTLTSSTTQVPYLRNRNGGNGNMGGDLLGGSDQHEPRPLASHSAARLIAAGLGGVMNVNGHDHRNLSSIIAQSSHLAYDETFVSILVEDENDNAPVFANKGKPIVSAVPLEASFGYEIARVSARDLDSGLNSQIKYEIQSRADDASTKFYIDPTTGVVRSMVNFALDSGRVYNFDVKATDRDGQDNGNSATIQIYVYVLPETKMVLMVTDTEPIVMEKRSPDVIGYLSNVTGFDVKMAKLEPHIEGESPEPFSTDLFLYAVNPTLNSIVDTETLLNVFRQSSQTISSHLHAFKVRRIQGVSVQEKISQIGATEVAIIALAVIVCIGGVVAMLFLCPWRSAGRGAGKSSNSSQQSIWDQQRAYSLKNPLMAGGKVGSDSTVTTSGQVSATNANVAQNNGYLLSNANHRQTSNSTYSTGDGANSEYVDSLISYKRSSGSGGGGGGANGAAAGVTNGDEHAATGRGKARADWTMDSELAAAMNEHHLHHLQHHHHHHHQHNNQSHNLRSSLVGMRHPPESASAIASAIGGAPVKGPRARLAVSQAQDELDPNTEVHSDAEVFGDEDEDDVEQAVSGSSPSGSNKHQQMIGKNSNLNLKVNHSHHHHHHQQQTSSNDRNSIRSADRSMYSGDSNWAEEEDERASGQVHMIDHSHQARGSGGTTGGGHPQHRQHQRRQ